MAKVLISLVGAGPGDPDLLTVKALRLIQQARTVVYDRLVSREILRLIPEQATQIFVGKASGRHSLPQQRINQLLVDMGRNGESVVRLKGGDPLIFGRGGEEALALAANGIDFEIVPGISAAQACSTYAGIPLTHRGLASGVQFISGHFKSNQVFSLDRNLIANADQTLVFYMGLANIDKIVAELLAAGRDAQTPAAIIENGTTPRQRQILSTIAGLPADAIRHAVKPPALLVVGRVVELAQTLAWFMPYASDYQARYA